MTNQLTAKLKQAKTRTRQWALGINLDWPSSSCLTWQEAKKMAIIDNSEITNLGRGGKRSKGMKFIDGMWIK